MTLLKLNLKIIPLGIIASMILACETSGGGGGFSDDMGSSSPINAKEDKAYKAAMLKCYKTGGSRVVKIQGKLRCY